MATSYQRIALSDSIGLHQIIDPKFKTNTLKVRFLLPLHPAHAAAHALAGSLLTTSCQKYPSLAALSKKSICYTALLSFWHCPSRVTFSLLRSAVPPLPIRSLWNRKT